MHPLHSIPGMSFAQQLLLMHYWLSYSHKHLLVFNVYPHRSSNCCSLKHEFPPALFMSRISLRHERQTLSRYA
jgi:hypothetical protein